MTDHGLSSRSAAEFPDRGDLLTTYYGAARDLTKVLLSAYDFKSLKYLFAIQDSKLPNFLTI